MDWRSRRSGRGGTWAGSGSRLLKIFVVFHVMLAEVLVKLVLKTLCILVIGSLEDLLANSASFIKETLLFPHVTLEKLVESTTKVVKLILNLPVQLGYVLLVLGLGFTRLSSVVLLDLAPFVYPLIMLRSDRILPGRHVRK